MGRIEPAQGNWKLMDVDVPATARVTCGTCQAKLSMLSKEVCCYDIPFMNMTFGS